MLAKAIYRLNEYDIRMRLVRSSQTAERPLPKRLTEPFELLHAEVLLLFGKREIYQELFLSGPEAIGLLNFAGRFFFLMYRDMLVDDILLTIRRITDRKSFKSKGETRDNLSLSFVLDLIDDAKVKKEIEKVVDEARDKIAFAKAVADKRIAHTDLLTKQGVEPLPEFNMLNINAALSSIANVMNTIAHLWHIPPTCYEALMIGEGTSVINRLRQAKYHCYYLKTLLDIWATSYQPCSLGFSCIATSL